MTDRNSSRSVAVLAALCALLLLLPAAVRAEDAGDAFATTDDEQAQPDDKVGARASSLTGNRDLRYVTIARDPRLCPSPLCGGFWVTSVNQSSTVCADGSQAARCYVAELDFSLAGLSPEQEAKVRGA